MLASPVTLDAFMPVRHRMQFWLLPHGTRHYGGPHYAASKIPTFGPLALHSGRIQGKTIYYTPSHVLMCQH